MNFTDLHLEEMVALPPNYKEIILERKELSRKLRIQDIFSDEDENWVFKNISPFKIKVVNNKNEADNVLLYQLYFDIKYSDFTPFLKFIREWGKQHKQQGMQLNFYFTEWLGENVEGYYSMEKDGIYQAAPSNSGEVLFQVTNETSFFRLLKDISTCFRTLATQPTNDPLKYALEFEYDESELEGKDYYDLANHILPPMICRGLIEGLEIFRKKVERDKNKETEISIEIEKKKKAMLFYYGDDCKGKPFYEFKIGKVLSVCLSLIHNKNLGYTQELSHWFTDAVYHLPEKAYKGLNIIIEVPEIGGDSVFEYSE